METNNLFLNFENVTFDKVLAMENMLDLDEKVDLLNKAKLSELIIIICLVL